MRCTLEYRPSGIGRLALPGLALLHPLFAVGGIVGGSGPRAPRAAHPSGLATRVSARFASPHPQDEMCNGVDPSDVQTPRTMLEHVAEQARSLRAGRSS